MKKTLFILMAVIAGLTACQKSQSSVSPVDVDEMVTPQGIISVSIQTPADATKATDASIKDSKVNSVQLFIFNATGTLESSKYVSAYDGNPIKMTAKVGAKTVYAVLNHDRLNFSSLDKFETDASLGLVDLGQNGVESLIMTGKNTITVTEYDKNKNPNLTDADIQSLSIRVKRLVSKIMLEQIKVNFDGTTLEGGELAITDVYLTNVVGKSPLGVQSIGTEVNWQTTGIPKALPAAGLSAMGNWYSLMLLGDNAPAVTFDKDLGNSYKCSGEYVKGTAKAMNLSYLTFPNSATAYQASKVVPTAPVHTCLVIKGHIKSGSYSDPAVDKDTYYTFDLPVLEPNMIYKIKNIDITMAGADEPGERIDSGKLNAGIVVDNWTGTVELNYEF